MGAGLPCWPLRWDPYLCLLGVAGMELDGPLGAITLQLLCPGLSVLLRDRSFLILKLGPHAHNMNCGKITNLVVR